MILFFNMYCKLGKFLTFFYLYVMINPVRNTFVFILTYNDPEE